MFVLLFLLCSLVFLDFLDAATISGSIPIIRPTPTSNTSGVVLTNRAPIRGESSTKVCSSDLTSAVDDADPRVDDKIKELRKSGHVAPTSFMYLPLNVSNPFSQGFTQHTFIVDIGSAWNIVPVDLVGELSLPLGSQCQIYWGGQHSVVGRFTVIRTNILGKEKEVIFCAISNSLYGIVNLYFLEAWDLCVCNNKIVTKDLCD